PQAMIVGASCTAELIQDDPGGLAEALGLPIPVVALELPSYQRKEAFGTSETFYRLVRALAGPQPRLSADGRGPVCNILGPTALGFRHRDDAREIRGLLEGMGVRVNVSAPLDATPEDLKRLAAADFNVVLYPEHAEEAARHLEKTHGQPWTRTVPIGVGATREFLAEVAALTGLAPAEPAGLRFPWWSRSVDSTYLTGKRVFVYGDATHAVAMARVARDEMGFEVVGLGCYNREFARPLRAAAKRHGVEPLITDDYLEVEAAIAEAAPEMILGTQMERHIGKRLGIPCAVISAPFHVQDHPARYSPVMGWEGANVLFDTLVHPLVMGLEEHLLAMFREDFEFNDAAGPSHLGGHAPAAPPAPDTTPEIARTAEPAPSRPGLDPGPPPAPQAKRAEPSETATLEAPTWTPEGEKELKKIPFFVRGKARRNTEAFAAERGISSIDVETLYDAKAHFAR
ncbi:MAG: ferredoxin:protochlorophyllide reductase (ATP-dependent) subunit B, partial [Pseudomonadota bacterium]